MGQLNDGDALPWRGDPLEMETSWDKNREKPSTEGSYPYV